MSKVPSLPYFKIIGALQRLGFVVVRQIEPDPETSTSRAIFARLVVSLLSWRGA